MRTEAVYEFVKTLAPLELAENWDNPGLLINSGREVHRVLTCLDIKKETLEEARLKNCELILSHHPVIFSPLKKLDVSGIPEQLLLNGISAICMHTNLDAAEDGVNDTLASLMQMEQIEPFAGGMGRIGNIEPLTAEELAKRAAETLKTSVKWADGGKTIRKLAVISGAGGSLLNEAVEAGADALLTGEANHHAAIDAVQAGISIVAATHFATEFPIAQVLAKKLQAQFPHLEVFASCEDHDPYQYI